MKQHTELSALAAIVIVMFAPALAEAKVQACPGFIDGMAGLDDVKQFYADRAVEIVRAGVHGDRTALERLVAPEADFMVWAGDNGHGPRGVDRREVRGATGALAMIRQLEPTGFQVTIIHAGPISVQVPDCKMTAELLLRTSRPGVGFLMRFDFADGRLVKAEGNKLALIEGGLR